MTATQNQNFNSRTTCNCTLYDPDLQRIFLMDLDNLHGSGCPSAGVVHQLRSDFKTIGYGPRDLMYAAYNHHHTQNFVEYEIAFAWSPAILRPAMGVDGADNALIADAEPFINSPNLADRFDEVVIGSGDHIFIPIARQLIKRGLTVHLVVRNKASLSKRLQRETNGCIFLLNEQRCLRHDQPKNLAAPGHPNCKTANNQKRNNK